MSSPINVYVVFYGSWSREDRRAVNTFVQSISDNSGNSVASVRRWWRTTSLYTGRGGVAVTSQVRLAKSAVDRYSQGKMIRDDMNGVWQVIRRQIDSGNFPIDASAIYVVLTSPDVRLGDRSQGFCGPQGYCGSARPPPSPPTPHPLPLPSPPPPLPTPPLPPPHIPPLPSTHRYA
ncbi:unnamed protein product [Closterium sp. NIES-65]|nr:unnamed protein product [Closterium sp. NIES-65]